MSDLPLLVPLTDAARHALGGRTAVGIDRLPFRIGRESRTGTMDGRRIHLERRKGQDTGSIDLYLQDSGSRLQVSRAHCRIELTDDGSVVVTDLGSRCGTQVDGASTGGLDEGGSLAASEGSVLVIGTADSPYRFALKHLDRVASLLPPSEAASR